MDAQKYFELVERHRDEILNAECWLWKHPATGYKEWEASDYLAERFEAAGLQLVRAGNVPGFYTDIDTGRPGPKILILAELDALPLPGHPEAVNGCAHACGHNTQGAYLLGIALSLTEPGALDGLCGSIRLMAVPAEEGVELDFRRSLKKQGIIRFFSGKVEFISRGYLDDVDIAYMFHAGRRTDCLFDCHSGQNGLIMKEVRFKGRASHAGGSPQNGINALYAANLGLSAINALRETFADNDHIRVHPIITNGGEAVNIIPDNVTVSSYVRGASLSAIMAANRRINRALAGSALAMGAEVEVEDYPGMDPLRCSMELREVAREAMSLTVGPENVLIHDTWMTGSTDMGSLSSILPVIHPHISGSTGQAHGTDYKVADPEMCIRAAKGQILMAVLLLKDNAARAKEVIDNYTPEFKSIPEYLEALDQIEFAGDLVTYADDGRAEAKY